MAEADELVKQAVSALKAGRKAEARSILESVVEQNQNHEEAWLYLSALVDSLKEQEICLENVLALNPNSQKAKQGLETVRQKMASQQEPPGGAVPPPAAEPKPFGASSSPPIGAEFEMMSGDSLFGDTLDSQASPGFDAGATPQPPGDEAYDWFSGSSEPAAAPGVEPAEDSGAIPTSVDWGRDDRPATHGSGQDVEMPSAQEWDSWVEGLNITKDTPEAPEPSADPFGSSASPFVMDDSAPFGETSYMVEDDGDTSPINRFSPAGETAELFGDSTYEESPSWPSPFPGDAVSESSPAEDAFASGPFSADEFYDEEVAPSQDSFALDADAVEIGEEELVFDFDDESDIDDDLDAGAAGRKAAPQAAKPGAEYFRLIPGEIEAKAGRIGQRSLMLIGGIVALALLNLVSFALLLL
jgi:hypothetical protein